MSVQWKLWPYERVEEKSPVWVEGCVSVSVWAAVAMETNNVPALVDKQTAHDQQRLFIMGFNSSNKSFAFANRWSNPENNEMMRDSRSLWTHQPILMFLEWKMWSQARVTNVLHLRFFQKFLLSLYIGVNEKKISTPSALEAPVKNVYVCQTPCKHFCDQDKFSYVLR